MVYRLFLDSNIYARAHADDVGAPKEVVDAATAGAFVVVASEELVSEVSGLFRHLFGRGEAYRIRAAILNFPALRIVGAMEWRRSLTLVNPYVRDRADAPHFAAARAAKADVLVSMNRRSIRPGMFEVVPLASPEIIARALSGDASWPTRDELEEEWRVWARSSPRSPQRKR